jgi:hypothetical protein
VNLVKTIIKIYSQELYKKLFHIFPNLIAFSTYFRKLYEFLESLKENEKNNKPQHSAGPAFGLLAQPNCEAGPSAYYIFAYSHSSKQNLQRHN